MTLLLELPPDALTRLEKEAEARGMNVNAYAVRKLVTPNDAGAPDAPTEGESLLALVERIHRDTPPDAWKDSPPDGAKNYKHYLYGASKEGE